MEKNSITDIIKRNKKLTKETIDKINNYCKEEENKDVCDKQDETIKAINNAQDKALKKLTDIQ